MNMTTNVNSSISTPATTGDITPSSVPGSTSGQLGSGNKGTSLGTTTTDHPTLSSGTDISGSTSPLNPRSMSSNDPNDENQNEPLDPVTQDQKIKRQF